MILRSLIRFSTGSVIRQKHKFSPLEWKYYNELEDYFKPYFNIYKPHQKKSEAWKRVLQKRQKLKQNTKINNQKKPITPPQPPKLVIHDPVKGIEMPIIQEKMFFIVKIGRSLHKITKGAYLTLKHVKIEEEVGSEFIVKDIRMIGAVDFTVIGRPQIQAEVICKIIQKPLSQKLIIFKKKRRKQYKWNMGLRQELLVLKVETMNFKMPDELLTKAISLI